MRARLYLDEDISTELAVLLRAAGYDVVHANEASMSGAEDLEQFAAAMAAGRAILSFNYRHFEIIAEDAARDGVEHPGIIISYHQYSNRQLGFLVSLVSDFLDLNEADYLRNALRVLTRT